ncbi:MAG: hypothetical protein Q8S24_08565 [Eubacteriales bacterium]|nr:hypothetical protein [Eubacteriales bacterium]
MRFISIIIIILLITGCSAISINNESTNDDLSDYISKINELENENSNIMNMLKIIENTVQVEITNSSIYFLSHDPRLGLDKIREIEKHQNSTIITDRSLLFYEADGIIDFKVSEDNNYMAILSYSNNMQQLKMINHEGKTIFNYNYDEFLTDVLNNIDFSELIWQIKGFDANSIVLWGGFGGKLDTVTHFIYNIDSDEFFLFYGSSSDILKEYLDKYPVK